MDDDVRKAAAKAVVEKFRDLMEGRVSAVKERGEVERKIRGIDRALWDCRAAGRLFGIDIELPDDVRPGMIVRPNPKAVNAPAPVARPYPWSSGAQLELPAAEPPPPVPTPKLPSTALTAGEEPSIRDLILLYLRQAAPGGLKAGALRRRVEAFLNKQIHYKTVGMSLYRLSKETPPRAARDGLIWYFVPPVAETKNPGGETPGPIEGR